MSTSSLNSMNSEDTMNSSITSTSSTSSSCSSVSTTNNKPNFLYRNVLSMMTISVIGFFILVLSFESKMHHQTKEMKKSIELQHKLSTLRTSTSTHVKRYVAQHNKIKEFNWKPITDQKCKSMGIRLDPFPDSFEPELYSELYGPNKDYHHYIEIGRKDGYECSRGQRMKELMNIEILPKFLQATRTNDIGLVLEIGPFLGPMLIGDGVKYFDVMDLNGLKQRAQIVGYPEIHPVDIDYVSPNADLSIIPEKNSFSFIASSNVLPHQIDFIKHLQDVDSLLKEGGYYALTVMDKRYTFDHYLPETTIADVLDDYYRNKNIPSNKKYHKLRSVIEHRALTVHNDIQKHWLNDHGSQYSNELLLQKLQNSVEEYEQAKQQGQYVDVHNYHFTPQSLAFLIDTIFNLNLTNLQVHRLYETVHDKFEFSIVLKKCSPYEDESSDDEEDEMIVQDYQGDEEKLIFDFTHVVTPDDNNKAEA